MNTNKTKQNKINAFINAYNKALIKYQGPIETYNEVTKDTYFKPLMTAENAVIRFEDEILDLPIQSNGFTIAERAWIAAEHVNATIETHFEHVLWDIVDNDKVEDTAKKLIEEQSGTLTNVTIYNLIRNRIKK